MRIKRTVLGCAAIAGGVAVLTGCTGSFDGKGFIYNPTGPLGGAATSGYSSFHLVCNVNTNTVSGTLQYTDLGHSVRVNAAADSTPDPQGCGNVTDFGIYQGAFTDTTNGSTGRFTFSVRKSDACWYSGFSASISLTGLGPDNGYVNAGCLYGTIKPIS